MIILKNHNVIGRLRIHSDSVEPTYTYDYLERTINTNNDILEEIPMRIRKAMQYGINPGDGSKMANLSLR